MTDRTYSTVVPGFQYFLDLVPCRTACPVHTNAGAYVQAIAKGDTAHGYDVARAPNPLASICGRICAHPCESKCRRGVIDQPIQRERWLGMAARPTLARTCASPM